jgi:ectoine hydroxylase-related dioxygenase (phytanoyl-CoA dioxygenase family)
MELKEALPQETLEQLRRDFEIEGYCLAKGLFSPEKVEALNKHFEEIHADGGVPGFYATESKEEAEGDVLREFPRVSHPHRFSEMAKDYMIDEKVGVILAALFGEEVLATQSMYYFKPPGARGQSLHQDQFYLKVKPGNCIAAWTALDFCDRENGGMMIVPGTQDLEIDCSKLGAANSYEGGPSIPIPDGLKATIPEMAPGDTLFFNGCLIHGSGPNRTKGRWRRAFIGHYVAKSCDSLTDHYSPLVDFEGNNVERAVTTDGGPCGGVLR